MNTKAELEALIEALVQAWNRRDATAFAKLFTPDADYVTGDGAWLQGQAAIECLVRQAEPGGHATVSGSPSIRALEGGATAVFRWSGRDGMGRVVGGVTTCVFARRNDAWLIDRLQNTDEAVLG